jgi:hypothetical protein
MYMPAAFVVAGDAAATARKITDTEVVYRIGILSGLLSQIVWVFLVVALYGLLKGVNKRHAMLMLASALVIVPIGLVDVLVQVAPLILLSGSDFLSVFSKPQLDALALASLALRVNGVLIASAFWGLWLFPFGMLVISSGFFPKILGVLLILAGSAYLVGSFASIALPAQRQFVSHAAVLCRGGTIDDRLAPREGRTGGATGGASVALARTIALGDTWLPTPCCVKPFHSLAGYLIE